MFIKFKVIKPFLPVKVLNKSVNNNSCLNINGSYILGTKNHLLLLNNEKIIKLLDGDFYGISIHKKSIYTYENLKYSGRILKISLNKSCSEIKEVEIFYKNLPEGCHQIDFIGDELYITDTYHNRIIVLDLNGEITNQSWPLGKLENGRISKNYAHINSLFFYKNKFHLVCHNESAKTLKKSTLLTINRNLEFIDNVKTDSMSSHNIVIHNNNKYHCDSLNGSLKKDSRVIFKENIITRGLSISNDYIVIGGSDYSERKNRSKAAGSIYFLNTDTHELITKLPLISMVHEIRRLDKRDYSLSNTATDDKVLFH